MIAHSRWDLLFTWDFWKIPLPRYKNYGGIGWSAGMYVNDPAETDWKVPAGDAMDELFKKHDWAWQHKGECRFLADLKLVQALHDLEPPPERYGRFFRRLAIVAFLFRVSVVALFRLGEVPHG